MERVENASYADHKAAIYCDLIFSES